MKKLFFFAATLFAAMTVNAVTVPTEVLTIPTVPEEGWSTKVSPVSITKDNWTIFAAYELAQSTANQLWIAVENSGSTTATWSAAGQFPANTDYTWTATGKDADDNPTNDPKALTTRNDDGGKKGPYMFRVKNTVSAAVLVKSGSNKKRTIYFEAYELTNGIAGETATKVESTESNDEAGIILTLTELNKDKEYVFVVRSESTGSNGESKGNSTFIAIAFEKPSGATAVENIESAQKAVKVVENGQVVIIRNGERFNILGARL